MNLPPSAKVQKVGKSLAGPCKACPACILLTIWDALESGWSTDLSIVYLLQGVIYMVIYYRIVILI